MEYNGHNFDTLTIKISKILGVFLALNRKKRKLSLKTSERKGGA